jgi:hypothetical protein
MMGRAITREKPVRERKAKEKSRGKGTRNKGTGCHGCKPIAKALLQRRNHQQQNVEEGVQW